MRYLYLILLLFVPACTATVIVPKAQPGSQIDMGGERLSKTEKGVQLSVRLHEVTVRPSPADQNYTSFWVEVANQRNVQLPLKNTDFLLIDDQGRQYSSVDPAELVERLTDAAPYLVPYPYVGFYYLEDSTRAQLDTRFSSESSYFSSRRPEYIASDALPEVSILPASNVSGAIYFAAELRTMNSFRLTYQVGSLPGQKTFQMTFPFAVEKK